MLTDVEKRIVKLRNELKAQKVNAGIAYSQLLMPSNTPRLSYSGTANWSSSTTFPIARVRFRFIRTDGLTDPPLVNFTHDSTYSPTYKKFAQDNGFVITPNIDMLFFDNENIEGYIAEVGDGYVDFYVDYSISIREMFFSLNAIQIETTCQVVANVQGYLTAERLK